VSRFKPTTLSLLLGLVMLAGCVSPSRETPQPVSRPAASTPTGAASGLEAVIGRSARALVGLFGQPGLDIREGNARKLQFLGPACVLDTYLYPPRTGAEPVVTHVDARLPDGRDMDRASCVAALTAQQQIR
jgi:hypothetical protein